jgi:hypothetical protein
MSIRPPLACLAVISLVLYHPPAEATVLNVGAGQTYGTIADAVAAASAGDTIDVHTGTYTDQSAIINVPLTIQGVGGMPVFTATTNISNGKGFLVVNASTTIGNIEFRNAQVADGNGAGIRYQAGNLIVVNSSFIGNQDGILATPTVNGTGSLLVINSLFQNNGAASGSESGFDHALYATQLASVTVENSNFQGTQVGHDIKSRAAITVVTGNILDDGVTGSTSYAIDVPNGGIATIIGNTITQGPNTQNRRMIAYAAEGVTYADNVLDVRGNTFLNSLPLGAVGVANFATGVVAQVSCNAFDNLRTPVLGSANLQDNVVNGPLPACAVPEPSSLALLVPAATMLLARQRRGRFVWQPRR